MLDHITLRIANLTTSISFYDAALQPLGISRLHEKLGASAGYGVASTLFFWINQSSTPASGTHVAFAAPNRAIVDAFYRAAMSAGATDNGPPGPRPQYDEHYYGAFVLDPAGNNMEAVCRHAAP
jgi:catechol 2,3-dioxygenase-like lactoylglutathione lyase family enzyme